MSKLHNLKNTYIFNHKLCFCELYFIEYSKIKSLLKFTFSCNEN